MRYFSIPLVTVFIFAFLLIQPPSAQALVNQNTMKNEGHLCLWLVYQLAAQGPQATGPTVVSPLGPAADGKMACEFLTKKAGIQPEGGWKPDRELSRDQISGLCGYNPAADFESNTKTTDGVIEDSSEKTAQRIKELLDGSDDENRTKFKELVGLVQKCIGNRLTQEQYAAFRPSPTPSKKV